MENQSSKEKEEERPLNRFQTSKNAAHQACFNMAGGRNGTFTDIAKMTDDTNPHNGTVQRADFGLIHPAKWQSYHIATKRTHQP